MSHAAPTRDQVASWDAADPLAGLRAEFAIPDDSLVYLDGNSLGRPPATALDALRAAAEDEWAGGLIGSWADWEQLPAAVGDLIAAYFLGARPGEVVVADSTSVNLYRLILAALDACPGRRTLLTDAGNFPSDRYVVDGVAARHGLDVRLVPADLDEGPAVDDIAARMDDSVAVATFSHVSYRSGAVLDLAAVTRLAHEAGALVLWDTSHSVGAVPIELTAAGADLAVGCTYKYLNGGPGSPAFLYVRRELQERLRQPVWGWFGQRDQFTMDDRYDPAPGIRSFLVGTPPVLALRTLEAAVRHLGAVGLTALRDKGGRLTGLALELTTAWLVPHGVRFASPRAPARRGSHVTLAHPRARALVGELGARGVVLDYREPDRLRLGLAPATTRFTDVWDALDRLRRLLAED